MQRSKKLLKNLSMSTEKGGKISSGMGVCDFTTAEKHSINKMFIHGNVSVKGSANYPSVCELLCVGNFDNGMGSSSLMTRTHGRNWFDGYELERLLKDSGSVCYKGRANDKQFIFEFKRHLRKNKYHIRYGQIIPSEFMKFKENTTYSFSVSVELLTLQSPTADKYITNFGCFYKNGTAQHMDIIPNVLGQGRINFTSTVNSTICEIVQYPSTRGMVSFNFNLDGTTVFQSDAPFSEKDSKYNGYSRIYKMKYPLCSFGNLDTGGTYEDIFDVASGKIERKSEFIVFSNEDEIQKITLNGVDVFAVKLKRRPSPKKLLQCNFAKVLGSVSELQTATGTSAVISDGGEVLYIKVENIADVESLKSAFRAKGCFAFYLLEQPYIEVTESRLDRQPTPGYVAVEACALPDAKIDIEYF